MEEVKTGLPGLPPCQLASTSPPLVSSRPSPCGGRPEGVIQQLSEKPQSVSPLPRPRPRPPSVHSGRRRCCQTLTQITSV